MTPTFYYLASIGFLLTTLTYGLIAYLIWGKESKTRLDRVFLFGMGVVTSYYAANLLASLQHYWLDDPRTPFELALYIFAYLCFCFVGPLIRHMGLLFLPGEEVTQRRLIANYLPALPFVVGLLVIPPMYYDRLLSFASLSPIADSLVIFLLVPYIGATCSLAYKALRQNRLGLQPYHSILRALGALAVVVTTQIVLVSIAAIWGFQIGRYGHVVGLVMRLSALPVAFVIIHSIFRYGFLDIVLKRTLLYSVLTAIFFGLYLGGSSFLSSYLIATSLNPRVSAFIAIFIIVLLFQPLREGCKWCIDRFVLKRNLQYRRALLDLGRSLTGKVKVEELYASIREGLTSSLGVERCACVVFREDHPPAVLFFPADAPMPRGGTEWHALSAFSPSSPVDVREIPELGLREDLLACGFELVVPVPGKDGLSAFLLLGPKPARAVYLGEEREALEGLANQMATALENVRLLERHVEMERALAHKEKLAALGELSTRVAHEIRNPITAAKSLSHLMSREPLSSLNVEHAQLVVQELDRVERSISSLLRFARQEEYTFALVNLSEVIESSLHVFEGRLREEGITVVKTLPPLSLSADAEKLRQVFTNFLQNACDALAEKEGERHITIEVSPNGTGEIVVHFADTGVGIPAEQRGRIFDPFFTTKPHGTGLGLAIVKKIVDAHRGRIDVFSEEGKGSTFTVTLPVSL